MPDEAENFQTVGPTWQERAASVRGIAAVYSPTNPARSQWLDLVYDCPFRWAMHHLNQYSIALDFGCGVGHRTLQLSRQSQTVIGVEITVGMIQRTYEVCRNAHVVLSLIDGIHIPLASSSVDLIWVSAVLRYSLLVPNPKHSEIVSEFFRILKPRGIVCDLEMYVDKPRSIFSEDFVNTGFFLKSVSTAHLYGSKFDRLAQGKWQHLFLNRFWAEMCYQYTKRTAVEKDLGQRLRDYFFVYQKL